MNQLEDFTPGPAVVGGALIGLSASLVLLGYGRVAGISGIFGGLLDPHQRDQSFRGWFVAGLLIAGLLARIAAPGAFESVMPAGLGTVALAGLLVGFGTRLGNGCTSGHGVCGISRLSPRSLVATVSFMAAGMFIVFVTKHALGGFR